MDMLRIKMRHLTSEGAYNVAREKTSQPRLKNFQQYICQKETKRTDAFKYLQ